MNAPSKEFLYPNPASGILMLLRGIGLLLLAVAGVVVGAVWVDGHEAALGVTVILIAVLVCIPTAVLSFRSLVLVNPNQSKVVLLFGRYKGTLRQDGFFAVNPF